MVQIDTLLFCYFKSLNRNVRGQISSYQYMDNLCRSILLYSLYFLYYFPLISNLFIVTCGVSSVYWVWCLLVFCNKQEWLLFLQRLLVSLGWQVFITTFKNQNIYLQVCIPEILCVYKIKNYLTFAEDIGFCSIKNYFGLSNKMSPYSPFVDWLKKKLKINL